ncbi:MAG: TlpA disulfide reductase family protein [Nitrospirota bacterium]
MKNKTLLLIIIIVAAFAVVYLVVRPRHVSETVAVGDTVPDFELVAADNKRVKLSDLRGSVVLINFWATWCESCIDEMPSLENLSRTMSGDASFRIVTILYRDTLPTAVDYLRNNGYTFPVYDNPDGSAARYFGLTGVPETYIIGKKGVLREKVIGPAAWDSPGSVQAIRALTNEPS